MNRVLVLVAAAAAAGQVGCASARYVQRGTDEGVVAIADRSNSWPSYNQNKAFALIKEHVGTEYEIVEEWADKPTDAGPPRAAEKADVSTNNQLFFLPNDNPRGKAPAQTADATEWRMRYRRKIGGASGWVPPSRGETASAGGPVMSHRTASGSGGVVQAAYQTPAVPPLVLPATTVVPAGGPVVAAAPGQVIPPPVLPKGW